LKNRVQTLFHMRHGTTRALLLLAALAGGVAGCDDDNTVTVAPTPPVNVVDTFSGTLTPYSVRIHGFAVAGPGTVSAILTEFVEPDPDPDPDTPTLVGVDIGTLVGTTCQVVVSKINMTKGQSVTGASTTAGALCVRIYDVSDAGLPMPLSYTLTLSHF
jgi:hypothetical protein